MNILLLGQEQADQWKRIWTLLYDKIGISNKCRRDGLFKWCLFIHLEKRKVGSVSHFLCPNKYCIDWFYNIKIKLLKCENIVIFKKPWVGKTFQAWCKNVKTEKQTDKSDSTKVKNLSLQKKHHEQSQTRKNIHYMIAQG